MNYTLDQTAESGTGTGFEAFPVRVLTGFEKCSVTQAGGGITHFGQLGKLHTQAVRGQAQPTDANCLANAES